MAALSVASQPTTTKHRRHRSAHSDDFVLIGAGAVGNGVEVPTVGTGNNHRTTADDLLASLVRGGEARRSGTGAPSVTSQPPMLPGSRSVGVPPAGWTEDMSLSAGLVARFGSREGGVASVPAGSASPTDVGISQQPVAPLAPLSEADQYAESMGASAPLLDLIDSIFELQSRGFMWRQVTITPSVGSCNILSPHYPWES